MGVGQAVIVAGIGCRKGASPADIEATITAALDLAGCTQGMLSAFATHADKAQETGIVAVSLAYGIPLIFVALGELEAASGRCRTRSARVLAETGLPSVAEAAALAAAGPKSLLLLPRVVVGAATCALATTEAAP